MNRKSMPLILMLVAGAVTCIVTFAMNYSIVGRLVSLLVVLLVFYSLGTVLKWFLDAFDRQNEQKAMEEGEVIEKENQQEEEPEQDTEET